MTVANSSNKITYTGNGATTQFPFTFKIFKATDIQVILTDVDTGEDTTLSTNYTVSTSSSYLTYPVSGDPLTSSSKITISRAVPITQETSLPNQGSYFAKTVENALDKVTVIDQQIQEQVDRTLKMAISAPEIIDKTMPSPVAGQGIGWNETGTGLINMTPAQLIDETNYRSEFAESTGYGIISGGAVTAQTIPNMTVAISAAVSHMPSGKRYSIAQTLSLPIAAADVTNPRIDLVYIDPTLGGISCLTGTPAASPVAPTLPNDGIALANVAVAAGATTITNANITDLHCFKPLPIQASGYLNVMYPPVPMVGARGDWNGTTGTDDTMAIQNIVNYALTFNEYPTLVFPKMCKTTAPIVINKGTNDRRHLYFKGDGGGIFNVTSGAIFTANAANTGDISFNHMKFDSVSGAGTTIIDATNLIRIYMTDCAIMNVDHVVSTLTTYMQTFRILNCEIVGGAAWAFESKNNYDVLISGCNIEWRDSFFRNTVLSSDPANNTLRIINNTIEGLSGKALMLGSTRGCTISGNYLEQNTGGYFDLSGGTSTPCYHNGLSIIGNTFELSTAQIAANTPAIILGPVGNAGVFSSGNVSTGALYSTVSEPSSGKILSFSDMSLSGSKVIGYPAILEEMGGITYVTNGFSYGPVKTLAFASSSVQFTANQIQTLTIPTTLTFTGKEIISVHIIGETGSIDVSVLNWDTSGSNIIARIQNNLASSQYMVAEARILQLN